MVIPTGIQWERAQRYSNRTPTASLARITSYNDPTRNKSCRLHVARQTLVAAKIAVGSKLGLYRGREPHRNWLLLEPADYGVQYTGEDNIIVFSVARFIKPGTTVDQMVPATPGENCVYFQLSPDWVQ